MKKKSFFIPSVCIALAANLTSAQSGFFVGASVNAQQDAYNLSKPQHNKDALENEYDVTDAEYKKYSTEYSNLKQTSDAASDKVKTNKENIVKIAYNQIKDIEFGDNKETLPTIETFDSNNSDHKMMVNAFYEAINSIHLENPTAPEGYTELQKQVFEKTINSISKENTGKYLKSIKNANIAKEAFNKYTKENRARAQDLRNKINSLNKQITTIEEINSLKSSSSKFLPSISLIGGYAVDYKNFGFITELGLDITNSKVSDSKRIGYYDSRTGTRELKFEVKNNFNLYLAQKAGYRFTENTLTYVTVGLGLKDTKVSFNGTYLPINEKKNMVNVILGVGYEYKFNKLGIFTEFNHIASLSKIKTKVGDVKTRSEQFKIGARYYF